MTMNDRWLIEGCVPLDAFNAIASGESCICGGTRGTWKTAEDRPAQWEEVDTRHGTGSAKRERETRR